jgi:hypothetical protein
MVEKPNPPKMAVLEPRELRTNDDESTTTTGDFPIKDEARRIVAAMLARVASQRA